MFGNLLLSSPSSVHTLNSINSKRIFLFLCLKNGRMERIAIKQTTLLKSNNEVIKSFSFRKSACFSMEFAGNIEEISHQLKNRFQIILCNNNPTTPHPFYDKFATHLELISNQTENTLNINFVVYFHHGIIKSDISLSKISLLGLYGMVLTPLLGPSVCLVEHKTLNNTSNSKNKINFNIIQTVEPWHMDLDLCNTSDDNIEDSNNTNDENKTRHKEPLINFKINLLLSSISPVIPLISLINAAQPINSQSNDDSIDVLNSIEVGNSHKIADGEYRISLFLDDLSKIPYDAPDLSYDISHEGRKHMVQYINISFTIVNGVITVLDKHYSTDVSDDVSDNTSSNSNPDNKIGNIQDIVTTPTLVDSLTSDLAKSTISSVIETNKPKLRSFHRTESIRAIPKVNLATDVILNIPPSPTPQTVSDITNNSADNMTISTNTKSSFKFDKSKLHNISSNEIIPASEIVHNNSNNDSFYQVNTSANKITKQTKESSLSTAALSKQALYLKEEAEKLNCLFESNDGAATTAALRSTDSPYAVLVDSDSSESEDSTDRNIRDEIIALEAYIPKILRNQIISQITLKCIDTLMEENEIRFENYNSSSIERFHGALLFVDISGFTLLSLCMNVESFKNCINKYFTTMLDVVKQFEGEVVKFAGDALFILWQTTAVDNESEFNQAAYIAANNALSCGLKINEVCNNYPVYYDDINNPLCAAAGGDRSGFNSARGNGGVHNARGLGPDHSSGVSSGGVNNSTSNSASDMLNNQGKSLVHLNVHSGVSIGILAGIDVGDSERWEYFLVGDPLSEALHAEKLATAGTIVASTSIYNILHPNKHVIPALSPQPSMRSMQNAVQKSTISATSENFISASAESSNDGSDVRRTSKPHIPTLSLLAMKNSSNNSNNSDSSESNSLSPVGSQLSSNNTSNISISSVNSMSAIHLQTNNQTNHNTGRSNSFSKSNAQTSNKQSSSNSTKKTANNFNFVPLFQCSNESMSMENPADSRDGYYKVVMKKSTFHKSNYLDSIHSPKMIKRHNSGSKNSSSNSNMHNASGNNYRRSFSFDSPSANATKFDEIINLSSKIIAKTASNNSTPLASNRNSIMTYNNSNNNSDYGSHFNSHNASRNVSRNSSFKVQNSTFQNTIINSNNSNNNSGNNSGGNSGGNSGQNSTHASNNTSFTLHNLLQHNSLHDFEEVGDTSPIPVPVRRSSFKNQKVHSNSQIIAAIEENQRRRNSKVDDTNTTIIQSNVTTTSVQPSKSKLSMLFGTASSSGDSADLTLSNTSKRTTTGTATTTHTSTLQPFPVTVNSAVNHALVVSASPPKHSEIDSEVFKALDRDLFYAANLPEDVHNIPENIKLQIIGAIERHVHEVVRSSLVLTSHMLEHYHTNHSGSSRSSGGSHGSSFNSGSNSNNSSSYSNSSSSGKSGSSHASSNNRSVNSNDSVTRYRNKKSQNTTTKQHSGSDSESSYDNSDLENEDIFTYSKSNSQKHSGKHDTKQRQPTADTSDYSLSDTLKTGKHKKTKRSENTENTKNTVEIESDSDLESYHSSSSEEENNHKKHRKHDKKSKKSHQAKRKSSFSNSKSEFSTMDSILTAELRQVVVLFIKIDLDCQLSFSESTKIHSNIKPIFTSDLSEYEVADLIVPNIPELNFLARTQEEYNTDLMLLETLQVCFSIIARAFRVKNGQIRQFIVDDKGTVCIGSFGLRGSTTENDSATAAQVANNILKELQSIGLNASIGITTGKAYCGLVGSPERHEYAIMGPSTNLSARLCCAAARKVGTILCDSDTKEHDRFHYYSLASSVQAKGYSTPVATFIPIFPNSQLDLSAGVNHNHKHHHKTAHNAYINSGSTNSHRNAMVTIDSNQNVLYDIEYLQESFPEEELSAGGNLESRKKNTHRSYFLDESIPVQNIPGKLRAMSDSTFATFENNSTNNNHHNNNPQHNQLTSEQEVQNEIANIHGRTKDCDAVIKFIYPPIVTVSDNNSGNSGGISSVLGTNGVKNAILNNNINNQIDKDNSNSSSSSNLKRNKSVNNINSIQNNNISNLSLRSNNSSNFSMIFPNNNAYNTSSWGQNKLKIVVFEGSSGVGLSSMLDLTCHKIHTTIKNKQKISPMHSFGNNNNNNNNNSTTNNNSNSSSEDTVIYFTQSNTVDTNSQFLVWKSIFIQLFIHLFKVIPEIEQNALQNGPLTSQSHNEMAHTTDKIVSETDEKAQNYSLLHTETEGNPVICAVLAHILSSLPKEYTTLKPLLNGYLLPKLGHENSVTAPLFGVTRARKLMEFLSVILQQCVNLLNKNVIIAIDDLQSMDSRSWWLLRYMWEHNTGIVVIASFRTENTLVYNNSNNNLNNFNNSSGNSNNANMSQLDIETEQTFTDPTRIKRIVIKPLDKINMSFFVCSMLKIDPFLPENDEISDKIFDLSGGNPLYANELIKTLLLKTGFSNNNSNNSNSSDVITDNNTAMNSNITQMLTPSAIRRKSFNLLRNSFIKPNTAANAENDSFTSISNNTDNNIHKCLQLPLRSNSFTRASPLVLPSTPRRSFIHPGPNNTNNPNSNDFSDHENQLNEQLKSKLYCEIIRSLKPNHRIEEVIYYKFDRLSSELQLIIKIACVAGMNGFQFTAKMIEFMLPLATQSEALNEKVKRKSFLKNNNNSNNNSSSSISSKLNLSRQNSNNNMQNSNIHNNIHNSAPSSMSRRRKSGSSISIHSNSNNDSFYSKQTTPRKHSTSGDHISENNDHGINTLAADSAISSPKTSSLIVSTQTVKSALRRRTVGSVHNLSALDMNLIHNNGSNSNGNSNNNSNSNTNSSGVDDILSPYYIGKSYNSPLSTTSIGNNKSEHNSSNHSLIYSSNNSTLSPTPINSVTNSTRKQRSTSFHNTVTDADDYTAVASPAYETTRSRRSTSFHTDLDEDDTTSVHSPAYGATRTRRSTSFHTEIDDANGITSVPTPANDVQIKIPLSPQISPKSLNTTPTNTNTITKRKSFTKQNSNNNMSLSDIHSLLGSNSNNTSMHNIHANYNNNTETKLNVAQLLQTLLDQNIFLVDARQSSGMREIRKSMMKFNKIGLQYEDIINEIDKINHSPRLDSPKSLSSPKSTSKSTLKSATAAVPEEQEEKRLQFHSTLVQSTIYEMMLETQKIYFHERLALYLEKQQNEQQYISDSLAQFSNNSNSNGNDDSGVINRHTEPNTNNNINSNESVYRINSISDLNLSINTKHNTTASNTVNRSTESVSASASDLTIQGLHWERAMVWRKAMNCYYQAGKILQDQGASNDSQQQLISAYWMFCEMRRSAGLNFHTKSDVNSNYNPFNSSLSGAVSGNSAGFGAKTSTNTTHTTSSSINTQSPFTSQQTTTQKALQDELVALSQDDVARIFNGVVSDFEIAINMLVKLAQCLLAMNERADVIASLYFEALQLVMTTRINGAAPLEEQLVSEGESGAQQISTNFTAKSTENVDVETSNNNENNTSSNNISNLLLKSALKSKSSSDKEYSGSDRELSGIMKSNHSRPRSNTEVETIVVNSNNNSPSKVKRRKSHSRETSGTPPHNSNSSTALDTNNTKNNTNNNRPSTPSNSAILTPSRRTLSRKRFSLSLFFPGQQQQYETDSNSSTDSLTSVMLSTHRNSYFALANYNTIFPILSGLIILYGLSFISESNNSSDSNNICQNSGKMSLSASNKTKKKNIVKLFLTLTRNTSSIESSAPQTIRSIETSVHHLRALTCQAWYFFDSTRYVEMLECTDTILSLYSFDTHHLELIKIYGADRVLHTIALAAKCSLCLGRVVKAGQYIDIVQKLLKSVTHLNTVAITTMPIVDTLLLFGCSVRCNEVFSHYKAVELQWTGYYSLLQPSNPFFAELINKKIELEKYNSNTTTDTSDCNDSNSSSSFAVGLLSESPNNSPRSPPFSPRATSALIYETLLTVLDTEEHCADNDPIGAIAQTSVEQTLPATAVQSVAAAAVSEFNVSNEHVLQEGETTLRILRKYARGMETVQAELCLLKVKELFANLSSTTNSSDSSNRNNGNDSVGRTSSATTPKEKSEINSSNDVSQQPLSVAARLFATNTLTAVNYAADADDNAMNIKTINPSTQHIKQQIVDYCNAGLIILNQVFNSVPNYSALFPFDAIYGLWTKSELTLHSTLTSSDVSVLIGGYEKALACLTECEIICDTVKSVFHKLLTCKVRYSVICTYEQMLQHHTTCLDDNINSNNINHSKCCDETIMNSIKISKQQCIAHLSSLFTELIENNSGADNMGELEVLNQSPVLREIKDLLINEATVI